MIAVAGVVIALTLIFGHAATVLKTVEGRQLNPRPLMAKPAPLWTPRTLSWRPSVETRGIRFNSRFIEQQMVGWRRVLQQADKRVAVADLAAGRVDSVGRVRAARQEG
ncbi:hypothetical protein ACPOL_7015 (plasmid) [Acidisarcina polymorpha]|uniref:Uncharacterized protein n=2 Tax=Acidisarcina polymorpha TaxID=2211140 RepID=A0A2Z5GBR4_9BACT|nr:hypothetical protein ACPOL_7015 [Acidisarcina polymorpha]